MTTTQWAFFAAFVFLCIVTNFLWYRAKFLLRARGYPVSWVRRDLHWLDLRRLAQLSQTDSIPDRQLFRRLRTSIIALFVTSVACFGIVFVLQVLRMFGSR